jgi:hypothetical protein
MANRSAPPLGTAATATRTGCDDIFFIERISDGEIVMGIYFWDEPDTHEAAHAEAKARLVVQALNMPGTWVDQYHVMECTLRTHRLSPLFGQSTTSRISETIWTMKRRGWFSNPPNIAPSELMSQSPRKCCG